MPFIADSDTEELTGQFIPDDELSAPESKEETELSKVSPARPQLPEWLGIQPAGSQAELDIRNLEARGYAPAPGDTPRDVNAPTVNIPPWLAEGAIRSAAPASLLGLAQRMLPEQSVDAAISGTSKGLASMASGMTSPSSVAMLPAFAVPYLGPALMLKGAIEQTGPLATRAGTASVTGDVEEISEIATEGVVGIGGMAIPGGVIGARQVSGALRSKPPVIPGAAELFARTERTLPRSTEAARAVAEKPAEVASEVIAETPIAEVAKVAEAAVAEAPVTPAAPPSPHDFVPALRQAGMEPIIGKKGQIHQDIYDTAKDPLMLRVDEPEHGFVNTKTGQFISRDELNGQFGVTDSQGLRSLQAKTIENLSLVVESRLGRASEGGDVPAMILPDGTALIGESHPTIIAKYETLNPEASTEGAVSGFIKADGTFRSSPGWPELKTKIKRVERPQSDLQGPKPTEARDIQTVESELRGLRALTENVKRDAEHEHYFQRLDELEAELKSKQPEGGANLEKVQVQGKEKVQEEILAAESGQRSPPQVTAPNPVPAIEEATTATPVAGSTPSAPPAQPKWTSATSEPALTLKQIAEGKQPPRAGEAGFVDVGAIIDSVYDMAKRAGKAVGEGVKAVGEIGKEALTLPPTSDLRRSVLGWSSKLQRSFNESAQAQKEIMQKVPDAIKREGITNWIQAGGDAGILQQRAAASSNPKLKAGYEAALNLTPDELAVAADVKAAFDSLGQRGQAADVLNNFRENYTPQIWDLKKGPHFSGSRTLRDRFRFSKARVFESFAEGEQAGFVPKTKDIAKLLPVYLHEMNTVIAARQLVSDMAQGVASDGRPLVAPRGAELPVDNAQGKASLVIPKMPKGMDTLDYKVLENQPALTDWRWLSKDAEGNNRFIKADLALHPEAMSRMKAVLGKSAIREWYQSQGSLGAAIPKVIAKAIDNAQSGTKKTMLGLLAPFHQVQEGTHAVGHRINPFFNIPKVDLVKNVAQLDATKHGLMLAPDRASANQFMEGLTTSGLVSKIPGIGKLADHYSHYLFHEYIPGLKYKTYEAILERNSKVFDKQLKSGEVKPEDVKILSAEQANAAYGHLNYADLGRNPTIQHMMQLGLLAPDFLEARARFAGQSIKGVTGAKVGREQMLALGTLAVAQAVTAWTAAQLTDGEWAAKHPFEFRKGNRKYTMRSVPEDIAGLIGNTRSFVHSRLSPIVGKAGLQYLTGVDWAGRPVSAAKTTQQAATQFIPLNLRGFEWVRDFMGESPIGGLSPLEQTAGSLGLRISRYRAGSEVGKLAGEFNEAQGIPRGRWVSEEPTGYALLRDALHKQGQKNPMDALQELRKTKKDADIWEAFKSSRNRPFTGSLEREKKFKATLTPEQRATYDAAKAEAEFDYQAFLDLWRNKPPR